MNYNFKAFIFDLDGTLCNTMFDLKTAMNEMLRNAGLPERTLEQLYAAINCGAYEFVRKSVPEEYRDNDDFVTARLKEYTVCYEKHYLEQTVPYDGIIETILEIKKRGYKIGVLSNKKDNQCKDIVCAKFGKDTFDAIMGQTDLPTKPDPTSAFVVAEKLGYKPQEIAFIGDSNVDMNTAVNAGMYPVGVSWGYRSTEVLKENGAKIIFDKPDQLLALCER